MSDYSKLFEKQQKYWEEICSSENPSYLGQPDKLLEIKDDQAFINSTLEKMGIFTKENGEPPFFDLKKEGLLWEVLEIGCGWGRLSPPFIKYCKGYTGVDISKTPVFKGNEVFVREGINNAKLKAVDVNLLNCFEDQTFDLIFAENVFIHTPPGITKKYLEQIPRKLKIGGRFIFEFNIKYDGKGIHGGVTQSYSLDECNQLFFEVGLEIVRVFDEPEFFVSNQRGRHFYGIRK